MAPFHVNGGVQSRSVLKCATGRPNGRRWGGSLRALEVLCDIKHRDHGSLHGNYSLRIGLAQRPDSVASDKTFTKRQKAD